MDASRYFSQQLSGRFFRIALLSFFLFSVITALLVFRDDQITSLAEKDLPLLTKQNQQPQQILLTYLALENLAQRTHADKLKYDYAQAQQKINNISLLINNNKPQLDLMYIGHEEFAGVVNKLTKNHDRNHQLKQNTIIQLQLINDQIATDVKQKQQQKNLLLQQISSDKFTDNITATRAKAYATQITELSHLQQLQQTIIRVLLAFQQLNLQYSILDFDDVSTDIRQALTIYLPTENVVSKNTSLLIKQLITLEQLLFSQQNTVAKWRSHLRLSRLYVEFIKQQQLQLQRLVLEFSFDQSLSLNKKLLLIDWLPIQVTTLLSQQKIFINNQHLQVAILGFIVLLFLFLVNMIFNIKKKIKKYGQESVLLFTTFIESIVNNENEEIITNRFNSMENKKIAEEMQIALETMINPIYSEKEFQQTIANKKSNQQVEEIKKLKNAIKKLEQASDKESLQLRSKHNIDNEKLSNMVVRTMLQSQSVSIGSGVNSLQVYRQLSRIFDWCRQNEIRTQFSSALQPMILSDVALYNEIDAALLNIISDTHFQRNNIYYLQDEKLLTHAKLDIRLFHRLLNGICRLLLVDLFKATLQVSTRVIDKNEGQQMVCFDFSVTAKKAIAKVPEEIKRLLLVESSESAKITANDTLAYLNLLFDVLNVTNKNVQLQENGYQFSFTLPIAFADIVEEISVNKIDLQQANVLLLSSDNNICGIIDKALASANGLIENLSKPALIFPRLSTSTLMSNNVDLVILSSDLYIKWFEKIQQHISSLATNIQPKLFVIQPGFNAPLERHGLFEQGANPLKISALQQSIYDFLTTEKASNHKLNASTFIEHQYLVTQVEVLFAVEAPTKHLTLIRILQWLGLQVKIVSQPKGMSKFWSSGRYLLLFTEFEQSPFIEMAAGKGVRRDIFTLSKSSFSTKNIPSLAEKWRVSVVPKLDDIDALVTLLQPWLKAKHTQAISNAPLEEQNNDSQKRKNIDAQKRQTSKKIDQVHSALDLTPASKTNQSEPFNLEQYAKTQGSAELAIVMLDDYIADIDDVVRQLSTALDEQNYPLGISLIHNLMKIGTILAAQNLLATCKQLLLELNQDKIHEHQLIMVLFEQLNHQKRLLSLFAEAI
jgi:HPt (histidine-containing phosphotransfer) domain-containing protein